MYDLVVSRPWCTGTASLLNDLIFRTKLSSIKLNRLLPWQHFQLYAGRTGGVGQRRIRVVPAVRDDAAVEAVSVTIQNDSSSMNFWLDLFAWVPERQEAVMSVGVEDSRSSESPKGKTGRRLQQMRLDACLSPPKTSTGSVPHPKPTGPISLKQLLQGSVPSIPINASNQKTVDCNSPEYQTIPSPAQHPADTDAQLATFYARSRLHHLSSWANELRDLVQQLRDDPAYRESGFGEEWKRSVILQSTDDPSVVVTLRASQTRSSTKHTPPQHRFYFHIDMDCFFVSVSLRNRPELKDKPVAITHASSSGDDKASIHRRSGVHSMSEVASCSYTARKAGIRNGMLLGQARQLCPELITLPYEFEAYKEVSEVLYRTVSHFTLNIQAVSCDELYADCTDLLSLDHAGSGSNYHQANLSGQDACFTQRIVNPLLLGARLRSLVEERTGGCTASIGFGSSKLLARLATKKAKPNGQAWFLGISGDQNPGDCAWRWAIEGLNSSVSETSLPTAGPHSDCELTGPDAEWLSDLPLQELPGIGRVLVVKLATAFNVTTCGELMRSVTRGQLIDLVGRKTGERLYWLCRGRDPCDQLHVQKPSKSVSACMNYGIRLQTLADMENLVRSLTTELVSRMSNTKLTQDSSLRGGVQGQNLTVRVFIRAPNAPQESAKFMGHGICKKASRMISLPEATADPQVIQRFTMSVLRQLCPDVKDLRGLGLQMHRLSISTVDRCVNKPPAKPSSNTSSPPTASTVNSASCPVIKEVLLKPAVIPESVISDAQVSAVSHTPVRVRRRSLRLKRRSSSSGLPNPTIPCFNSVGSLSPLCVDTALTSNDPPRSANCVVVPSTLSNPHLPDAEVSPNQYICRDAGCHVSLLPSSTPLPRKHAPRHIRPHSPLKGTGQIANNAISPIKLTTLASPGPLTQAGADATGLFATKTMDQIKQIFANWITSEPCPQLEDICILASYLVELVPSNLERVRLCLVCLDRLITQLGIPDSMRDWRTAYSRIFMTVDYAVEQCYGNSKLKLHPG
ncbi:hypothetical protein CRM22_005716 [Opisthorchis felineus]|uniref:DNA repair protein REV1 n=1 Tax=Opisthorchis felineus TaxID=147828 RepID=A0A4S2LX44_OPIFE|nr:hypothetical protein CRM22_005716 [Opisthorchis felineus]